MRLEAYSTMVKKIIAALENAKLDYAFTGALAVSFYGAPRTTTDVDVILAISDESDFETKILSAMKQAGFRVDKRRIDAALTSGYEIATLRQEKSPYTVDLIMSVNKFEKKTGKIYDTVTFFQTAECLIAAKLRMIKATLVPERSIKDKEDIMAILAFTRVDLKSVKKQAQNDKTLDIFEALINDQSLV